MTPMERRAKRAADEKRRWHEKRKATREAAAKFSMASEDTEKDPAMVIASLLDELLSARQPGTSILLISHDLPLVCYAASRLVVMRQGRLIEDFPTTQLCTGPHHPYTWSLIEAAGLEVPSR